jgi:MFS family permease
MRAPAPPDRLRLVLPLLGWLAGAVFFFYAWVLRVAPSVMVEELMRDFSVGAAVLGHLSAAYFYGYAGMQIPVGILLDRFGPRRLMTVAAFVCAGGCVLFATAETLSAATAGRVLIGASAAFSLVGAMAIAGQWFPPDRFALLSGLAMAAGMAGGVFGQAPLRLVMEATDWRTATMLLAGAGALLGVAIWASVRDKWRGKGGLGNVLSGLGIVFRHRQTWLIALTGLATSAPLLGFAGLWGVPFFEAAYGLPRTSAAALASTMIAGWGFGAPSFGWLSDRIGLRKAPLFTGLTLQSFAFAGLVYIPGLPVPAVAILCFLIGFFGASQIICFALVKESHPAALSGTSIGFINAMVTGTGALFQPLVGLLLDLAWKGQTSPLGARLYETDDYRLALTSIVACCVIGFASLCAVRETYCRAQA